MPKKEKSSSNKKEKKSKEAKPEPSHNFDDKQVSEFKIAFELFDKDGDGTISWQELGEVMKNLGKSPTEEELKDLIHEADTDKNGSIDFEEFLSLMGKKTQPTTQLQEIKDVFKVFDKDGNGFIDREELKEAMAALGEALSDREVDEMLAEADSNGDGQIDLSEWIKMMGLKE